MRRALLLFLTLYVSNIYGQGKTYDYCYRTGPESFGLYSIADGKGYPIFGIVLPKPNRPYVKDVYLSPDGKKVAYVKSGMRDYKDRIVIMDLNTKRKTVLNSHCMYCDKPEWSPDGKWIAYNTWTEKQKRYSVGVIDVANKLAPKILTQKLSYDVGIGWEWANDSKKLISNDLDSVFFIDLVGNKTNIYKTSDIGKTKWCSDFIFTTDGKKIVFLRHEDHEIVNSTGGSSAVYVYDIVTKKALRISPKNYDFHNVIIHGNKILASGEKGSGVPNSGIYSIDLDGKNFKLVFPNVSDISLKN